MNFLDKIRENFTILNNLLTESIFLPDTMQEFCRKNRYNFSKFYLNKFLLFSGYTRFSIFTNKVSHTLLNYFSKLGFLNIKNKFFISGKGDLHDMFFRSKFIKYFIDNNECKYIFTYKNGYKTDLLAKKLNISVLNNTNAVEFLSDKKNLYKIFPKKYLPKLYNKSNLSFKYFVIKPRLGANSRGIFIANGRFIEKNIKKDKSLLIQEYIEGEICHSVTFINISDNISILYTAQQTIQKVRKKNGCFNFSINNSFITSEQSSQYKKYYDTLLSLVIEKKTFFAGMTIFLIEFILSKNGEIKIMEINPRIGSSIVMANFLFFQSNISKQNNYYLSNQNFHCKNGDKLINHLKDNRLLFLGNNINSVLPINISKKFNIIDLIIIGRNKKENNNIVNFINTYLMNENS